MTSNEDFNARGSAAYRAGDVAEALSCFDAAVAGNVRDWNSLAKLGSVHFDAGRLGHAYVFASAAARLNPSSETLSDLGRVLAAWGEDADALALFQKAHELNPAHLPVINNAGLACLALGRVDDAWSWFTQPGTALDADVLSAGARDDIERNKAFVHLLRQDWARAWLAYDRGVGHGDRVARHTHLPPWRPGAPGPTVVYGEQGIGDEILFASCLPDALEDMERPIIETMPRLVGLFARSFRDVAVYGTRYETAPVWLANERPVNKVSIAELPGFYRTAQGHFPGSPFLRACSGRRAMMRGLLAPMPRRRKVGLAWTGGTARTGYWDRSVDLAALMKALAPVDAEFISLEHSLGGQVPEDLGVHVFPYVTDRALDYDYTASLVRELDLVVAVPTAVAHLAGALGTRCLVLLNDRPGWRCGGSTMPWYRSVEVLRDWTPDTVRNRINDVLGGLDDGA